MNTERYASDLTDGEWAILEPLIRPAKPGGRPRTTNLREVLNGIFYLLKTGCQWRMLPKEFPKWKTVNDYYAKWRKDGTWQRLNDELREQVRTAAGRDKTPSAGSIDPTGMVVTIASRSKRQKKGGQRLGRGQAYQGPQTASDSGYSGVGVEGVRDRGRLPRPHGSQLVGAAAARQISPAEETVG